MLVWFTTNHIPSAGIFSRATIWDFAENLPKVLPDKFDFPFLSLPNLSLLSFVFFLLSLSLSLSLSFLLFLFLFKIEALRISSLLFVVVITPLMEEEEGLFVMVCEGKENEGFIWLVESLSFSDSPLLPPLSIFKPRKRVVYQHTSKPW